jgi:hypothetical protein
VALRLELSRPEGAALAQELAGIDRAATPPALPERIDALLAQTPSD